MRVISIDIGMNNLAAVTNNIGKNPVLIRGKKIKAENQWYNKITQPLRRELEQASGLREKRRINDNINRIAYRSVGNILGYFNSVSDWIITYCAENAIDTVIIGEYKILERENFISIPFEVLYSLLEAKCKYHNIKYIVVNEKYTSGTSFFDGESPTREYYDKSRRVYKHLWRCNNGEFVNADINDSYQIMKKAYPEIFKNGTDGFKKDPIVADIEIGVIKNVQ